MATKPNCQSCVAQKCKPVKKATYGVEYHQGLTCLTHKEANHQQVYYLGCEECDELLPLKAQYGTEKGKSNSKRCENHKLPDDKNLWKTYCIEDECFETPIFTADGKHVVHCLEHALEDENILFKSTKCHHPDCYPDPKRATFGIEGEKALFCKEHKSDYHVDVHSKRCIDCTKKRAHYGPKGGKAIRCGGCKLPDDICVSNKLCVKCEKKSATFGSQRGRKYVKHCMDCREPNDIDCVSKLCIEDDCDKRAIYGSKLGHQNSQHCKKHATADEFRCDVKPCGIDGCEQNKEYGDEFGYTNAERCINHKLDTDVHCFEKKCSECSEIAIYGQRFGKKFAIHCEEHRSENDINSFTKNCIVTECEETPLYGERKGARFIERCKTHKLDTDVHCIHKGCIEPGCDKQPNYGIEPGFANMKWCVDHKPTNASTSYYRKCEHIGCEIRPYFGPDVGFSYAVRCNLHKLDTDVNVSMKKCLSCGLLHSSDNYDKCQYCRPGVDRKTKEMKVVRYLQGTNDLSEFIHDKITADDHSICGKYRPDIVYDCGTHFVIVEVDENQHTQYDESCETTRMNNIMFGLGLPTIFLRFNPDAYMVSNKKKLTLLDKRMEYVCSRIRFHRERVPEELLTCEYLFYDQ